MTAGASRWGAKQTSPAHRLLVVGSGRSGRRFRSALVDACVSSAAHFISPALLRAFSMISCTPFPETFGVGGADRLCSRLSREVVFTSPRFEG